MHLPDVAHLDPSLAVAVRVGKLWDAARYTANGEWCAVVHPLPEAVQRSDYLLVLVESEHYAQRLARRRLSSSIIQEGEAQFSIELPQGVSANLIVNDADGVPATDCVLWLNFAMEGESSTSGEVLPVMIRRAVTDSNGRVLVRGLDPGEWIVTADEGKWWEMPEAIRIFTDAEGIRDSVLIVPRLAPEEYFEGRLRLPAPREGKCLELALLDENGDDTSERLECDADGRFYARLERGRSLSLRVNDTCQGVHSEVISISGGTQGSPIDVVWK